MCTFITSWVNEGVDKELLNQVLKKNGFDLDEYAESPIKAKLRASIYFRPTTSSCDCGTPLGSNNRENTKEKPIEDQVKALRDKGWSESKIARWNEERDRANRKKARSGGGKGQEKKASTQEWLHLFDEILNCPGVKAAGVLFHHYHGNQTIEDFPVAEKVRMERKDLTEKVLTELRSETPYEIFMRKGK